MKPPCHMKGYAIPIDRRGCEHGCGCTTELTDVLISVRTDPSSVSQECLPLKSSAILRFAVLCPVSSQLSPPPYPTPVCRPPANVFLVSVQGSSPQGPALR